MHVSSAGIAFIVAEEGLRLQPYNDTQRFATVGVGHLIGRRPVNAADIARYRGWTREDFIALFRSDIKAVEEWVTHCLKGSKQETSQNQFDMFVSLTYNIGNSGFLGSTVLRKFKAGDVRGSADAFLMWKIGGPAGNELLPRRKRERSYFLKTVPIGLAILSAEERKHAGNLLYWRRVYYKEARTSRGPKFDQAKSRAWDQRFWIEERVKELDHLVKTKGDTHNRLSRQLMLKKVLAAIDGTL